jgi:hypothetical protein
MEQSESESGGDSLNLQTEPADDRLVNKDGHFPDSCEFDRCRLSNRPFVACSKTEIWLEGPLFLA